MYQKKSIMDSVIVILVVFACACMAETPSSHSSGAEIGYALESFGGWTYSQFVQSMETCLADEDCHIIDAALDAYPIPDDEYVESMFPAIEEAENKAHGRLLAGLPDKHNWANSGTRHCANEGGWCSCHGNVVYTKKCAGTFSCSQANWGTVVSNRYNSNHKSNVNDGVRCDNGNFGGDPWPGHDKQCFCHPHTIRDTSGTCNSLEYINIGVENRIGGRSVESDWDGCRNRCRNTDGCLYFTWWWDGGCHLGGEGTSLTSFGWAATSGDCGVWSEPISQFDYVQKWTEEKCHSTCGRPGADWWSDDFWKGVYCGFSCTGSCTVRAAAFVAGREHTFPIEDCAEFCYCVFKGWTG